MKSILQKYNKRHLLRWIHNFKIGSNKQYVPNVHFWY